MSTVGNTGSPASYPPSHAAAMGSLRFIEASSEINEFMKMHVINLAERGQGLQQAPYIPGTHNELRINRLYFN